MALVRCLWFLDENDVACMTTSRDFIEISRLVRIEHGFTGAYPCYQLFLFTQAPTSSSAAKAAATTAAASAAPKISRVRALYDFTPTESGELGFQKGDIIRVLENVYRDWWKGELRGKTGIFPVNYVEKIVDPTPAELQKEAQMEAEVMAEARNVEQLLQTLASVDARKDAVSDNEQLQTLYNQTLAIRPKLVRLIEKYSQKKGKDEVLLGMVRGQVYCQYGRAGNYSRL